MDDVRKLIVVQVTSSFDELLFKLGPEPVFPEVILLKQHCFDDVDESGGQKVWQPLLQISYEHFVNRLVGFEHVFKSFFRHIEHLLQCLVKFNFRQFLWVLDQIERHIRPLLVDMSK